METAIITIHITGTQARDYEVPKGISVSKLIHIVCQQLGKDEKDFSKVKLLNQKVIIGEEEILGDHGVIDGEEIEII